MKRGPRENPDMSNCQKQLQPRAEATKGELRGSENRGAQRTSWEENSKQGGGEYNTHSIADTCTLVWAMAKLMPKILKKLQT